MSLTFITGPAHAGKTTYIYEKVASDAKKEPDRNFFVVVPEQYTLSTQKKLTSLSGGAILNIDVLSFARLTHRIFEELGLDNEDVLEDTGKNLLLRKVINERKGELAVLKGEINRMGYVDEIKSFLTELDQYRIGVDELERMAVEADTSLLELKLKDIALLKNAFEEKCKGKYITSERLLEKLALVAAESKKLSGAAFVFDGFTGFTPVQMYFLKHLMLVAVDLYVTLTIDDTRDLKGAKVSDIPENDLFYITKKCYVSLRNLAVESGQKVSDTVVKDENIILKTAEDIRFLGDHIYRAGKARFDGTAENISVRKFQTPVDELNLVAAEIKRLVRTKGYRYRDFAVICGDDAYFALSHRVFLQYEIPVFVDEKKSTAAVPIVAFVKNIFKVSERNFSIDSVMDLVRTTLAGLSSEECDRLENYLYANGIKARWKWERSWADEEMNELRKRINSALGKLSVKKGSKKAKPEGGMTAGDITKALYAVMEEFGVPDKIYEYADSYEAEENTAKSTEYIKCYEAVMNILDKIYEFLGDEEMDYAEYTEVLSAGLDKLTLGVIPLGSDYVTVGDIERSRLSNVKVLFITGAAEGNIPHNASSGGILSQIERQSINERTSDQLATDRERALSGRFYIMDAICKPTDALYFSYAGLDGDGKSMKRSYLLDLVEREFEGLTETVCTDRFSLIESKETCKKYIYESLSEIGEVEDPEKWRGALSAYLSDNRRRNELKKDLTDIFREDRKKSMGEELADRLYGKALYGSVSNLEKFASCAYSYFLRYGLKLKERDVLEFDSIKLGNMLHEAVDEFWKRIKDDGRRWQEYTEEETGELAETVFSDIEKKYTDMGFFENDDEQFRLSMIKDLYVHTVETLGFHLRQGLFDVADTEYKLESDIELSNGKKMHYKGSADRIDVYEKGNDLYLKVLDLKSYNNKLSLDNVYYGLQLQLLVYLHEAMESETKKRGKTPHFGGVFYYDMEDPVVDAPETADDVAYDEADDGAAGEEETEFTAEELETIDENIKKKHKLSGIHTDNIDVIKAIDKGFGNKGLVLKGSITKDNKLNQHTKALSNEDFKVVDDFVMGKVKELGDRIMSGEMDKNPYYKEKKSSCESCDYKNICDFDRDDGDDYRWLNKMENPQALEAMKNKEEIS